MPSAGAGNGWAGAGENFIIKKKIRLIELFAGVGSQAMALRDLGADFEHYGMVEFDSFAVASYNAVHGTSFPVTDIRDVSGKDLGITDTDRYCYVMTYSFPCQDLSVAGKRKGMAKGAGTRSGLLWEVERLLNETPELPQVLLMENVPAVHGEKNAGDFMEWVEFLRGKGYSSFWRDLNAKDYGVAQNRNRCFMVSILGIANYEFPEPVPLKRKLRDYLEDAPGGKFFIGTKRAKELLEKLAERGLLDGSRSCADLSVNDPEAEKEAANCITARENRGVSGRKSTGTGIAEPVMTVGVNLEKAEGETDVAHTLLARDYKGFGNRQLGNGVVSRDGERDCVAGSLYLNMSYDFQTGISENARAVKAGNHDLGIVTGSPSGINALGNLRDGTGSFPDPQAGRVYSADGNSPALNTCQGGEREPKIIVAMRGRNPDDPSDRTPGMPTEQRLEPNSRGMANTLTGVQKDNMVLENTCINDRGSTQKTPRVSEGGVPAPRAEAHGNLPNAADGYRIRKLTPRECWRLMGFTDEDYEKAAAVNSDSQLYKQAGNSIVRDVLMAIFAKLLPKKE